MSTLKRLLIAGITGIALLATLALAVAWKASDLWRTQSQIDQQQVTVNVAPVPPFSNVVASTVVEHREGRILLVHQTVEPPPAPEIDLDAYPYNSYGSADVKVWRVDAGTMRRVRIDASHLKSDVGHSKSIILAASDPVGQPASVLERAGFTFRRDGGSRSPLNLRTPQRMPRELYGHPVPSAHVTQVMVPHWFLLALSALTLAWSCRWLWRNRRSRLWAKSGRCGACGYDLRASPDRCPECGGGAPAGRKGVGTPDPFSA